MLQREKRERKFQKQMLVAEREGKVIKAEGEGGKEVSETNAVRLEGGERTV